MSRAVFLLAIVLGTSLRCVADDVRFNRDVRPLLAAKCFACHGPDEEARVTDLRLDTEEGATADLGGYRAIHPGRPDQSELIRRITSDDPDERMPPSDSGEKLTPKQIQQLTEWVAAGGRYDRHWAFIPPQRPEVPSVADDQWSRNEIDRFILRRLRSEGLEPSPAADRYALVRRLYLDLIGLPPTPAEADAFVNDDDPQAWEKLVDRLMESHHYGERWARVWLDLARYADTHGYEKDRPRSIWPWRDWVIRALNADMPFDQFTIEQLAGDMLPGATEQQRIATGFHRNTMLNEEGGIDPLEYRFYAMVDRVATTGTVWLGLTTGCAQCHSHKYDPISHTDYYSFLGLLNNADEPDLIVHPTDLIQRRTRLNEQIAELETALPAQFPAGDDAAGSRGHFERRFREWQQQARTRAVTWTVLQPSRTKTNLPRLETLDDGSIFSSGDITKRDVFTLFFPLGDLSAPITALRLEVLPDDRLPARGPGRAYYEGRKGDFFLSEVTAQRDDNPVPFKSASHSFGKISIGSGGAAAENVFDGNGSTGWSTAGREGESHQLVLNFAAPVTNNGELEIELLFERHFAASLGRFRVAATSSPGPVTASALPTELEAVLSRDAETWSETERDQVLSRFLREAPELAAARKHIDGLRRRLPALPTTMILQERPSDNPRVTHRHHRGEYLSPREEVTPRILSLFAGGSAPSPRNRLELAQWLSSDQNPLVDRVTVNRAWRAFFGRGLVRTSGDFGTQSDPPSHPELLDWLACEFRARGQSFKELHRLLVTSAAYRQSARLTPDLLERDPGNRLLARATRFRVDAETVRDIMLKASGLLSTKMYGPGVYPPQPASVTAIAYGNTKWKVSQGEDRYRRSLYTFSKRTAPFAAYTVFDGPTGETCLARRDRSNTPLQALTLLNDPMYIEMGRALAALAVREHPDSIDGQATEIFRRLLTRPPRPQEVAKLLRFREAQLKRLQSGELDAATIAGATGKEQLAAWAMVARVLMNLDESITRQ